MNDVGTMRCTEGRPSRLVRDAGSFPTVLEGEEERKIEFAEEIQSSAKVAALRSFL